MTTTKLAALPHGSKSSIGFSDVEYYANRGNNAEESCGAMAVVNQQYLAHNQEVLARMLDTAGAPILEQRAVETKQALEAANAALNSGQVTLELSKDAAPVLQEMKMMVAKLELIDQRLQAIEKKSGCNCAIL